MFVRACDMLSVCLVYCIEARVKCLEDVLVEIKS